MTPPDAISPLGRLIRFFLENKLLVFLLTIFLVLWGVMVAPFDWELPGLPRAPVPVDAIPDIGENQQIVFTPWAGRSPQDVEDQITYPLTSELLGVPSVRTIRSFSYFGFSSIYVIFEDDVDFYWSRSRLLEKLNSLSAGTLPEGVRPALGPDATALGQVFWYTLEGRDPEGNATGGWDLHELRSTQDWYVRYALLAVQGIAEVASVGGFIQEYQIDVDPDAMRAYGVNLEEVFSAVRMSNVDVGARTIEVNRVEYMIRGLGFIQNVRDIEQSVIKVNDNVPITIKNVATVALGPALRRGALDKGGAEAVGGVAVVRYGDNPLAAIEGIKKKIEEISPGLPRKILEDGTISQVAIIPFYDRSGLIHETLGTLNTALEEEILVTIIVILLMLLHIRSSILISGLLPLAVLMTFIAMKVFGIDANIVALSGIAIAIGTIVDMGVVVCENILKHLDSAPPEENRLEVVYRATVEVGGAVTTAVLTTVVSFLPVFTMEAAEGKLFKPLAFTKTFALLSSVIIALVIIPTFAQLLFTGRISSARLRRFLNICLIAAGVVVAVVYAWWAGLILIGIGAYHLLAERIPKRIQTALNVATCLAIALAVGVLLSRRWAPLGPERGNENVIFVIAMIGGLIAVVLLFQWFYEPLLRFCLARKLLFLSIPAVVMFLGLVVWIGAARVFGFVPEALAKFGAEPANVRNSGLWVRSIRAFPGLGKEFMPPLDEGSFLFMPSTMPHASIGEAMDILRKQDMAIRAIPEVESVVGKIGRVDSPLDPAPISMVETVINYRSEYVVDEDGRRMRFRYDETKGEYPLDEKYQLIPDPQGRPFRQWRTGIKSPDDIWDEIIRVTKIPGSTVPPKLQPIETRLLMLQTGMRAPMGVKVFGTDLESIERVGYDIERLLKEVPLVNPATVLADRVIGKPYLEIDIDRDAIARFGMHIRNVQDVIEVAIGGKPITTTVEGRERYPVRVRYLRELRDQIETIEHILVPAPSGAQIPLSQLARIRYRPGPQVIKSEDTFLVSYVVFDMRPGYGEVNVVEACQLYLEEKRKSGEFVVPAGVSYAFTGSYENQVRSEQRLRVVLPLALFVIFLILYFQFRSTTTTLLVFSGILVAWAGGFLLLWLYGREGFLDFTVFGTNMRDLFQIHPLNLSVAVWVGFLALFGIASDNGVILATYLNQSFERERPDSIEAIREATLHAGMRRIRPCLMTTATTILALIPVLTSTGRGADVMVPMAIPSFGGMALVLITVFVVPTLYCAVEEFRWRRREG